MRDTVNNAPTYWGFWRVKHSALLLQANGLFQVSEPMTRTSQGCNFTVAPSLTHNNINDADI